MTTYKRLKSILNHDGRRLLADIYKWADETLTGPDLIEWQQDMTEFLNNYYDIKEQSGDLRVEPIILDVSDGQNYNNLVRNYYGIDNPDNPQIETVVDYITEGNVQVGFYYTIPDNFTRHQKELKWLDRMSKDPNVIFRQDELVS